MNNLDKTIVPIHLDGLFVPSQGAVPSVVPLVDFTKLNDQNLYLGEELTTLPLTPAQGSDMLAAGVHLHWALPDALTKSTGLQLVSLQSFCNVFGDVKANEIWSGLQNASIIKTLSQQNTTAKVLLTRNQRSSFPDTIATGDIPSINNILDQPSFPAVPDRWLISRFADKQTTPSAQWIVESDYVWPSGADTDNNGRSLQENYTAYPFRSSNNKDMVTCGFVGRSYNIKETPVAGGSYLPDALTAIGYGEPNFAAFYPTCRSVFGFADMGNAASGNHFQYELLGWYNDPEKDYYQLFISDFISALPAEDPYLQLLKALKDEFQWFIPVQVNKSQVENLASGAWDLMISKHWVEDTQREAGNISTVPLEQANTLGIENAETEKKVRQLLNELIADQLPQHTLFFARLDQNNSSPNAVLQNKDRISLAVGNSAAEAMSAHIASELVAEQPPRDLIEDYLEALQLEPQIAGQQIDLSAKFREARHRNGFSAVNAGTVWSVRPLNKTSKAQDALQQAGDARKKQAPYEKIEEVTLPVEMSDLLNELNIRQQQLDQCNDQQTSVQQQLFAHWSAYLKMQRMYISAAGNASSGGNPDPQNGGPDDQNRADDPDDQDNSGDDVDWEGNFRAMHDFMDWAMSTWLEDLQKNATMLKIQLAALQTSLQNKLVENNLTDKYELKPTAAPRYWAPTEPVLLITGVKASDRHGRDGRMREDKLLYCEKATLPDNPAVQYDKYAGALQSIDYPFTDSSKEWHPIMLDWKLEFYQTTNKSGDEQYSEDYLASNYDFDLNAVDFTLKGSVIENALPFWGRSILTPSGALKQKDVIIRKLVPDILSAMMADDLKKTDADGWKEWLTTKSITDASLLSVINDPLYTQPDEWIAARLNKITADSPGGIIAWYQAKVEDSILRDLGFSVSSGELGVFVQKMMDEKPLRSQYYDQQVNKTPDDQQTDFYLKQDQSFVPWLKNKMANAWSLFFSTTTAIKNEADEVAYVTDNFDTMISWYQDFAKASLHSVLTLQSYLQVYNEEGLSQSLGGFNNAMLNNSQSYQLHIVDPDEQYKGFADQVRTAVKQQNTITRRSSGDFSPIRAGNVRITDLWLVNNFGQMEIIDLSNTSGKSFVKSAAMRSAISEEITLMPRIAPPARLNFRWLSAHPSALPDDLKGEYLEEMNSHPASSPICGWLMTNQLDNSIMCYDGDGTVLGYLDSGGAWRLFPGRDSPVTPAGIENAHLSELINRLSELGRSRENYINDLISTIDIALDNIEPANTAQQDALALLIGRPIAIVRAAFSLEQKGLSATYQRSSATDDELLKDLAQFLDLKKKAGTSPVSPQDFIPNTLNYDAVTIPLRIGEYRQLNDGLVGYWVDQRQDMSVSEVDRNVFYAPQSSDAGGLADGLILTHTEEGAAFEFKLQLNKTKPFEVTMLLDITGKVHASCGILPVKSLEVPADQYKQALSNIEAAFLTAPLLTLPERLQVSLPREPGYGWSWIEKDGAEWKTISYDGTITREVVTRVFGSDTDSLWSVLLTNGWLEATADNNVAKVVAVENRTLPQLDNTKPADVLRIEQMLEGTHINPFDPGAAFSGTPVIREGWLKLSGRG